MPPDAASPRLLIMRQKTGEMLPRKWPCSLFPLGGFAPVFQLPYFEETNPGALRLFLAAGNTPLLVPFYLVAFL